MRILQLAEEENMNKEPPDDIDKYTRNSLIYNSNDQLSVFNEFAGEDHSNEEGVLSKHTDNSESKITPINDQSEIYEVYHHDDSDIESFYNIWGKDDEWLYNNKLRNVVRDLHR